MAEAVLVPSSAPIAVTVAQPFVVAIPTTASPQIAFTFQGPQGPSGPAFPGFGQVTYSESTTGPEDNFQAGVRQQLRLAPGMTIRDLLNPPFAGHAFLINNRIVARAMGDFYAITVNLVVTAQQDRATIKADIDVGSPLGPTGSNSQSLSQSAGTPERVTFQLVIQALSYMLTNGAAIYLTSDVAITVLSESIIIHPASTYPGVVT